MARVARRPITQRWNVKAKILVNIGLKMVNELNLSEAYKDGQILDLPQAEFDELYRLKLCEPLGVQHAVATPETPKIKKVAE